MGCAVVAFTSLPDKAADFADLPAFHCVGLPVTPSSGSPDAAARAPAPDSTSHTAPPPINTLLLTSNAITPSLLRHLIPHLARRATIVLMTIQSADLVVPYMDFVLPGHRLIASTEASARNHVEMLKFVARHGIEPRVQRFKMDGDGVAGAFEELERGRMRYRGVLVAEGA